MRILTFVGAALALILAMAHETRAAFMIYDINTNGGLAGFNPAAGKPPNAIDFDSIPPDTNIDGADINGVQFNPLPGSAPLIVVPGNATVTPHPGLFSGVIDPNTNRLFPTSGDNVLSPGGLQLVPGFDPSQESDELELIFQTPLSAFGFEGRKGGRKGVRNRFWANWVSFATSLILGITTASRQPPTPQDDNQRFLTPLSHLFLPHARHARCGRSLIEPRPVTEGLLASCETFQSG
jgi:hypothetical protein